MMLEIFISQAKEIEQYISDRQGQIPQGDLAALEWALNSAREAVTREMLRPLGAGKAEVRYDA